MRRVIRLGYRPPPVKPGQEVVITEADRARVAVMLRDGLPHREIAERFPFSKRIVGQIASELRRAA